MLQRNVVADMVFRSLIVSVIAGVILPLSTLAATVYAPQLPVRSGVIMARIETDKSSYRVGEPIKIRLTLENVTQQQIYYIAAAPYEISDLHVSENGQRLLVSGGRGPCICEGSVSSIPLPPGKPIIVEYNDRRSNGALRQWAYIQDWGYNLTQPGYYSLAVSPAVNAIGATGPEFRTSSAGKSNVLHITITK